MQQPVWLAEAWREFGQRERAGSGNANARIAAMYADAGHPAIKHDEVPWCAAYVGAVLHRAGLPTTASLMARSYLDWGTAMRAPEMGAVAVLTRGSNPAHGHVGFYVGETDDALLLLGGNQGDAVSVAPFSHSRLLGFRWPATRAKPANSERESRSGDQVFEVCLTHVLRMEGGYTNDPHDPGGPTNKGVTLGVFAAWRKTPVTSTNKAQLIDALRTISDSDVRTIYAARYWQPGLCAEMAPGLAAMHFDACVNHGVFGATKLMQRALGVDADGEIGPLTRAAIKRRSTEELIMTYAEERRRAYRGLAHFWRFGRGWLRRVDATVELARSLLGGTPLEIPATKTSATKPKDNDMSEQFAGRPKWWGQSLTIWGAIVTASATVLPALGPLVGIDITGDLVREAGSQVVTVFQALTALIGTMMTVYGRVRADQPLAQRDVLFKF